jgi:hypothetical protein
MKKNLILLFFILITINHVSAQMDSAVVRSPYWYQASMIGQIGFLYGMQDGLSLGSGLALSTLDPKSDCYKKALQGYNSISMMENIRLMDIQDEINKIYNDSTNLCLTVNHVFWLAANKLSNMDSVSYKNLLDQYKKNDCVSMPEPKKVKKTKKSKTK